MFIFAFIILLISFLPCLLAALKLDRDLAWLARIYAYVGGGVIAAFVLAFIITAVLRANMKIKPAKQRSDIRAFLKDTGIFLIPAVLLWAFFTFVATPSYVCDNTEEIVATALTDGDIYIHSAFTGEVMQAGLPIFDKVLIMPMFYATVCRLMHLPYRVLAGLVTTIVFFGNLSLVYRLTSRYYPEERDKRQAFLCVYLFILFVSTYLPTIGVPVTLGYAILRMGYSGWAAAYGLVIPLALSFFSRKQIISGLITLSALAGLIRLDRIFFLLKDAGNSLTAVNLAGKLAFLYIIAVVVTVILNLRAKEKTPIPFFFIPSLLISHVIVRINGLLGSRKERLAFSVGALLILLATADFRPIKDITFEKTVEKNVKATLDYIPEGSKILANTEYMRKIRQIAADRKVAYSRAADNVYLQGLDFEAKPEYYWDFSIFADYYDSSVRDYPYSFIEGAYTIDKLVRKCVADGITVFVIPEFKNGEEERDSFAKAGAVLAGTAGEYCIYVHPSEE